MKVGIMSMQRIVNYGSFLQAYSLKKTIEELGHEVEFVDYEPGKVLVKAMEEVYVKRSFFQKVYGKINWMVNKPSRKQLDKIAKAKEAVAEYEKKYQSELLPILGVGKEKNIRPQLDALVIGSDEVFNCLQTNPDVGYATELFGANHQAKTLLSYAASFGNTTKESLNKYGITKEVANYLKAFDYISVRDTNSKNIVESLMKREVEQHVDPVFLYDYTPFMPQKKMGQDYIVVYAYWSRITREEANTITKFAKKNNKKIICLCAPQRHLENFVVATPFEILAYIRDADYVITDTFHGTVFSIKYNKNFSVFVRKGHEKEYGNSEKLYSLLNHFNLTERIVSEEKSLDSIMKHKPEYELVNQKILEEQESSKAYLRLALGEVEKWKKH